MLARLLLATAVACLFAGCSSGGGGAPVINRDNTGPEVPRTYKVMPRDTLYSIAWNYGLDYKAVAAANGIAPPYTIYAGQTLYLQGRAPGVGVRDVPERQTQRERAPSDARTSAAPSRDSDTAVGAGAATPQAPRPVRPAQRDPEPLPAQVSGWSWPTRGVLLRRFSGSVHKGIDIGGERGDPVYPTAPGRVVYAGGGIVGYGELLIVKHSARYLSAYGHNDRLLVKEGDQVRSGQKVAEKGSSGTNRVKLHFEIRRDGRPVDPLSLLPKLGSESE